MVRFRAVTNSAKRSGNTKGSRDGGGTVDRRRGDPKTLVPEKYRRAACLGRSRSRMDRAERERADRDRPLPRPRRRWFLAFPRPQLAPDRPWLRKMLRAPPCQAGE